MNAIKKEIEQKQNNKYKVLDEKSELLKLRILNNKLKSHEFVENEKINQIRRNNQLLLDRLLEISKGKWAAPGIKARVKKPKRRVGPKSLNYVTKRKELARIDEENSKLMKRILNQNPIMSTKKLENEYRERRRLQKSLQRNKLVPIQHMLNKKKRMNEKSTGRLPPLQNSDTPSAGESRHDRSNMPQSVHSSKNDKNTFDVDDRVESNQLDSESRSQVLMKDMNNHSKSRYSSGPYKSKPVVKHTPVSTLL